MPSPKTHETAGGPSAARLKIIDLALGGSAKKLVKIESSNPHAIAVSLNNAGRSEDAQRVKLANILGDAVDDNVDLASEILRDESVRSPRDIAMQYGFSRVHTLAKRSNVTKPHSASFAASSNNDDVAKQFARGFRRRMFAAEPTAVLQHMVSQSTGEVDPSDDLPIHSSPEVRTEIAKFLDRRPDFNIRTTSVLTALHQDQDHLENMDVQSRTATIESLKILQRVQALAPVPEATKPLLQGGFTSALRVSSVPKKQFVSEMAPRLAEAGATEDESNLIAGQIHDHATASSLRADHALIQIRELVCGTGLRAVDGDSALADRQGMFNRLAHGATGSPSTVNLDALFSDMDLCECEVCLDVTSPTAYYVDLLQYLRNNNLDNDAQWPNTGKEGIQGTALEKLFARRPDLQHLQLTCANANTALPMIDLANEVMEAFVIHLRSFAESGEVVIETWNIGRETTEELLASPSHTRKKAYCILKEAVFPLAALPYFQPLDSSRLYLNFLGTSRYELIDTFRLAHRQWAVSPARVATPEKLARYVALRSRLQDRAAAAEYLGLSPDSYVTITREAFWPIESSEFADNGTIIDLDQYRQDIGVVEPFLYWGYKTAEALLSTDKDEETGLTFVKAQFLRRSGFSYAETAELARTKYVNPMMPTGKDKVLLESIRFSYRFLQHLTVGIDDTAQRNELLSSFLFATQVWVHYIVQKQIPPTGNKLVKSEVELPTFTLAEIHVWVTKWFQCVGKLTVLEAGEGPRLPAQGYLAFRPPSDRDHTLAKRRVAEDQDQDQPEYAVAKVLAYLDNTGELRDENNDVIGFVWIDSKVYLGALNPIRKIYPKGSITLYPTSKQKVTPTLEELAKIPPGDTLYRVDKESTLIGWAARQEISLPVQWIMTPDSCSIENTQLIHLNLTPLELWEWDRINRFIRLYKTLQPSGWTISQLDAALIALWTFAEVPPPPSPDPPDPNTPPSEDKEFSFSDFKDKGCGCSDDEDDCNGDDDDGDGKSPCDPRNYADITPGFLKELWSIQRLEKLTGVELEKLLCLWSDIGVFGEKSLYARLFLTHDLEAMDDVFVPDGNGNYLMSEPKIGDHFPVLIAALRLKADIFDAVLSAVGLTRESIITVPNLTKLYRHALFSSILGIRPKDLLDALALFPNPYETASTTLELCLLWTRMSNASFTIKQLRYIFLGVDDPLRPIGPDKFKVLRTTKAIVDGLMAVDLAHPDLTEADEAVLTTAQVKAKALLIFEPPVVDDIVGLIEGTRSYTTNAPVGLVVDPTKAPTKLVYNDPLTAPNRRATLSVTGCLTEEEASVALALFPANTAWASALARLQAQAAKLVGRTLSGVFGDSLEEAVQVLTQEDVPASEPVSSSEPGDPGTALAKRVFFMKKLLPFIRNYLYSRFIVTTLSAVASVPADICTWLLSDVLEVGDKGRKKSAMQVLIDLKGHATDDPPAVWTGYLLAPSSDTFVFYGYGDTRPPPLILDGTSIAFETQNEDPSNLWWTAPVKLIGGKMLSLQVTGQAVPGDLQWKTERSGVTAIPSSALVPDASITDAASVFAPLSKASMVIQAFSLGLNELDYLQDHGANFASLDFNQISLEAWKRLLQYYELRKTLVSREKGLIDLFKWANLRDTATADEISKFISDVTTWDANTIKVLLHRENLGLGDVKNFRDEVVVSKLGKIISFIRKVGITDINLLLSWSDLKLDFNATWKIAKSIRQTIRGRYSASDYEQAIKPSHDQLRKNQRDALIAYLLVQQPIQEWGVTDPDGLFEFFLLDVQMGSCMQTSRTKQAISSAQLFAQRCFLGLEKNGTANIVLDDDRWKWMSQQKFWTSSRKVFLYPENWLIPSLRDRKTPIYGEMESSLLQRDVQPENVLESFRDFTTALGQIAHMRAVGVFVELVNDKDYVFHCVAMTAGAPYLFFYRNYDSIDREWTPWVRITVDIPNYTVEWTEDRGPEPPRLVAADTGTNEPFRAVTGCYVVPVAWKSRILLFAGEIIKKSVPNSKALSAQFSEFTKPDSTATSNSVGPNEVWEITLAWSEYRAGKWTQKQVSSEPFRTKTTADGPIPEVDAFQFLPFIDDANNQLRIEVWYYTTTSGATLQYAGSYLFDGILLRQSRVDTADRPTNWNTTSFHLISGRSAAYTASSLQIQQTAEGKKLPFLNKIPYVTYKEDPDGVVRYMDESEDIFHHPFSPQLISAASTSTETTGIAPVESIYRSLPDKYIAPTFGQIASSSSLPPSTDPPTADQVFAELSKPYSHYNWELGFHVPMQVAEALLKSQQFDQALAMMHQVFNPYIEGTDVGRVWQWYPFQHSSSDRVLEGLLNRLKPREFDLRITQWRDNPFHPFVVARGRIVAYMKWTVMMYIKTLIAYGDMHFRRRTLEDIPLAIQLYVLASHMYGPKGETIPQRGKKRPQTYFSLLDKWDAFSNAAVQLEVSFPFSNQTPFPWHAIGDDAGSDSMKFEQKIALANIFGRAASSYFCLPSNPELQALRATIDQRLYNIRNCLDIDGRPMPLVLWDAPIDPGQLIAAVASGLSLSSALNDLNASLPNYRFTWLLSRALELTSELSRLESTFLSVKEKRDSEALQMLRSGHEISVHKQVMEMKKLQVEEATKTLVALRAGQESSKQRFDFFSRLAGVDVEPLGGGDPFKPTVIEIDVPKSESDMHINQTEKMSEYWASNAQSWTETAANLEIMASLFHVLPSFNAHLTPMGCGIEVVWGTPNLAAGIQAIVRQMQLIASSNNFRSSQALRKVSYVRQYQDRVHQMNLAGLEFEHTNKQIQVQETRIKMSNQDIANQQLLIENATEVNEFLKNKYTNDELYSYFESTLRTSMYQTYQLAYDLAKKAELAFRFERRPTTAQKGVNFISFGYFNPARDGLQTSQQMYLALKNMDAAYQESRSHDYEIAKSVSLRQLNPYALMALRETGTCTFEVPEVAFDMDFPGHYFRRIKTVSITVPCVVGPHVGVNATLRLLKHRYRTEALAASAKDYIEDTESGALDPRFRTAIVPIDAVAASSGQNDAGAFELSIKDERYLPFEGAGAISTWQLTLPPLEFRPFDYASIADVVLMLKYTSCDGGAALRKAATDSVIDWVSTVGDKSKDVGLLALWDIRAEFATEWAKLSGQPNNSSSPDIRTLILKQLFSRLPAFVAGRDPTKVIVTDVSLVTNLPIAQASSVAIDFKYVAGTNGEDTPFDSGPIKIGKLYMLRITEVADEQFRDWALKVGMEGVTIDGGSRMWLIVRYRLAKGT
ncbi:hypothetical protein B0T10DRAFT_580728 [Thelonectria olida]|uniref:Uncharacterized protein n=1 Tax=Thelonectria olida TaxID=1576542 RepID=A0A9P9AKI8_9HYPO|nr:hypothetical protein B0T10DRAFT_580728 [Thelonectria olida]